jgi:UDP-glucose:(heptosyl)LPS alpha-1,3-glucosyltransferase
MHLAFAISTYFPFGGAQRDFIAIAKVMAARGHQISIITTSWEGERIPDWEYHLFDPSARTNHGRNWQLSQHLLNLKATLKFDCVIGFTRLLGLDVYFAADESFMAGRFKGLKRWLPRYRTYARIEQTLFANPKLCVLFLTEAQQEKYQQQHHLSVQAMRVMSACVDPVYRFDSAAFAQARYWRESQGVAADKIVLLFVAKDFNTKGLDRVLIALGSLSSAQQQRFSLWVVGDGKQAAYQKMANQLDTPVIFWGGQADLPRYYLAADCLVHPARQEAAGMVIAEALAAQLPILVSSICGYAYLAKEDPHSQILDSQDIQAQLSSALMERSQKDILERGRGSPLIAFHSRAEWCADQIEAWCASS